MNSFKGAWVVIAFPSNWPVWPMQKADGSWRSTVDYCEHHQMVTLIAVGGPKYLY